MTNTSWPDPERLGYPLNAQENTYHWLEVNGSKKIMPFLWNNDLWFGPNGSAFTPKQANKGSKYLKPCTPPSQLDAASFLAGRQQSVDWLNAQHYAKVGVVSYKDAADAIQSLPLPENMTDPFAAFEALADKWDTTALKCTRDGHTADEGVAGCVNSALAEQLRAVIKAARGMTGGSYG